MLLDGLVSRLVGKPDRRIILDHLLHRQNITQVHALVPHEKSTPVRNKFQTANEAS
jgi:hypothetical protein